TTPLVYYVFDLMTLEGVHLMGEPLSRRRELLQQKILPRLCEPIKYSSKLDSDLSDLIQSVKKLGLEGLIAKRRDSRYAPGLRTAAWWKMRVNAGQEFVIGGYTLGKPFDALVFRNYCRSAHASFSSINCPSPRPGRFKIHWLKQLTCAMHRGFPERRFLPQNTGAPAPSLAGGHPRSVLDVSP